ncbi:extracellular catalytic domain type 1 short-chain-length polyhydroxyalkanoate depolymerase [Noviherbaspirillum massiliense]|uniref:extracellular catalytic domain type 1 short-chain-length polyhydroxyalkanoate depolymerase n=1 Tax=Noviherbaspirillum massiliense TaxID=1465823 RepID=UPI0002D5200D|nr:PHB depolymerase family esterase [Noviherbaspirillum massiliense]
MKIDEGFLAQMREATQILQNEGPMAATAAIQRALHRANATDKTAAQPDWDRLRPKAPELRDINQAHARAVDPSAQPQDDMLNRLSRFPGKWAGAMARQAFEDVEVKEAVTPAGKGRFLSGSCTNHAGTRDYKLYIPSGYTGQALPLVVMLHGCTQNPDDFAAGTNMNAAAEDNNCFVVYPAQARAANGSNCWNWFNTSDQRRDHGEPAIIADITRAIIREYAVDTNRIYVAGLSAGGAMAAVLGASYPDLYAAIGIHSGLPYGVAHDVPSAFAAMKNGRIKTSARKTGGKVVTPFGHTMPVIVFHGDRDTTVDPANGDLALAQCVPLLDAGSGLDTGVKVEQGAVPHGRTYTRTVLHDVQGKAIAEKWIVHGAGHAWAGGSSKGSYTDPKGPDATREMLRFFYTHGRNGG